MMSIGRQRLEGDIPSLLLSIWRSTWTLYELLESIALVGHAICCFDFLKLAKIILSRAVIPFQDSSLKDVSLA